MQIGSLVVLKSNSPIMTVTDVRGDSIECTWFPQNWKDGGYAGPHTAILHKDAVSVVEPKVA